MCCNCEKNNHFPLKATLKDGTAAEKINLADSFSKLIISLLINMKFLSFEDATKTQPFVFNLRTEAVYEKHILVFIFEPTNPSAVSYLLSGKKESKCNLVSI